ncbi:unnamed protein product [Brachionus calyciflorus]|uniref:Uncharacterized protein n=1 Tax=Brachionus calyciflorus TaxID=104777 RepID=A0A813Q6Y0_9BILA|nr:unnamed protein product [Brachionus calyciflorus]
MDDVKIILPCGFSTLYKVFIEKSPDEDCFVCGLHKLNIQECLKMPFNELNLKQKELDIEINQLINSKFKLEEFKLDPDYYISLNLDKVKNELSLRREQLKLSITCQIDHYYDDLMNQVNEFYKEKKNTFQKDIISIDKFEKNSEIDQMNDDSPLNVKIDYLEKAIGQIKYKADFIDKTIRKLRNHTVELNLSSIKNLNIREFFGELTQNRNKEDPKDYKLYNEFKAHQDCINDLKLIGNDKILTASNDKQIKLWNLRTNSCIMTFKRQDQSIKRLCVLDNETFASCDSVSIKIWNLNLYEPKKCFGSRTTCLKLMKNGDFISSGFYSIFKWDLDQESVRKEYKGHYGDIYCLEESLDGKLISGSYDKTIRIWDENGLCINILKGHTHYVLSLKVLDSATLASCSYDKVIKIWNLNSGQEIKTLDQNPTFLLDLNAINNNILISGSQNGSIKFWNLETGACLNEIKNENNKKNSNFLFGLTIVSNKDKDLICGFDDGSIKIWKNDN